MFMLTISNEDRECVNTVSANRPGSIVTGQRMANSASSCARSWRLSISLTSKRAAKAAGWRRKALSASRGECWIYDANSVVFAGARILDDARLHGPCEVSHGAIISGRASIHASQISHHAQICDNVTISLKYGAR